MRVEHQQPPQPDSTAWFGRHTNLGVDPRIPFRGRHPNLYKRDDPEGVGPELYREPGVHVFDMSVKDDRDGYTKVLALIASGRAELMLHEPVFDQEHSTFRILVSYLKLYYEDADAVREKVLHL